MKGLVQLIIDWLYRELQKKDKAVKEAVKWEPVYRERNTDRIAAWALAPTDQVPAVKPSIPRCPSAPQVPQRQPGPTTNVLRDYGRSYERYMDRYRRLRKEGKL